MRWEKENFWLETPIHLFKQLTFIPKSYMNLEEKMNAITRFIFFVFLILYMIGYNQSILFLILSIIFIIIFYYLQKSNDIKMENYNPQTYIEKSDDLYQKGKTNHLTNRYTFDKYPSYFTQQVEQSMVVQPDQTYKSNNQRLVGNPNPKTRIAPVVAPPAYEWHAWKKNDLVVPNMINDKPSRDYYRSGYYATPCKDDFNDHGNASYRQVKQFIGNDRILQNASVDRPILNPTNKTTQTRYNTVERFGSDNGQVIENFQYMDKTMDEKKGCMSCKLPDPSTTLAPRQLINGDFTKFEQKQGDSKNIRYTGDVIEALGYDETNIQYNLPSNYSASNCQRKPQMSELNKQIFTSTIVPGVYSQSQIIEPIDYNEGISFVQQIPPRKVDKMKNGDIMYTSMDPKLYTPVPEPQEPIDVPSTYDVFDPRSNGYGTSYRGYTDKLTGRPRFYYDDVDAVRRPNFITRTEIDHLKNVDTYGPVRDDNDIRASNDTIRETVENAFSNQTLDFRTDMMTRLMRKRNAELWQLRMAPKSGMQKNFQC